MWNSKKRKTPKIGQMNESLTKHPRHDEVQHKIRAFIPKDLIYKILLLLPTRSMGRFRCISKSWLSISTRPSFIKAHAQHKHFAHQTLMIVDSNYKEPLSQTRLFLSAIDADINARINLRELPQLNILNQSDFLCSCDGLILSWIHVKKRHYIINPLTGHFCILPEPSFHIYSGFYFHRPTSTYRLLADVDAKTKYVLVIGETEWRCIHDRLPAISLSSNSVDVNESLYWLAFKNPRVDEYSVCLLNKSPNILMTFDKEAEVYNLLPLPPPEEFRNCGGSLMNFNGELGLWIVNDNGIIDFWIMKECWIKRYSVYHFDLEKCPRGLCYGWNEGFAVSIKDEELLIGGFWGLKRQILVHWNLKTGACLLQNLNDYSPNLIIRFPYIEALTSFDHSFRS